MRDAETQEYSGPSPPYLRSQCIVIGLGLALLHFFSTAAYTWAAYLPVPIQDYWEYWLRIVNDGGNMTWEHLWARHNEHRIVIARLLFEIDRHYFAGTSTFLESFNVCAPLLTVWVFWKCVGPEKPAALRALLFGSIFVCVYAPAQHTNFTWSFQNQFLLVHSFSFLGFHLFRLSTAESFKSSVYLAGSLLAGVGASLCMSGGLFFWPVIFLHSLVIGCGRRRVIGVGLLGAVVWVTYFFHYNQPGNEPPLLEGFKQFPKTLLFFFTLFGAPIADLSNFVLGLFGVPANLRIYACSLFGLFFISVALLAWTKWALKARTKAPGGDFTLCCMIAFFVSTGGAMAVGRAPFFGLQEALASRYATPAWYFAAAVMLLYTGAYRSSPGGAIATYRRQIAILIVLVAASSIFLPRYFIQGLTEAKFYTPMDNAVMAQVQDKEALSRANTEPDKMEKVIPFFRSSNANVFAARFHAPTFNVSVGESPGARKLLGFVDIPRPVEGTDAFHLRGWTSSGDGRRKVEQVFAVNKADEVVGWSLRFYCRRDLPWKIADNFLKLNGWEFYIKNVKPRESVRVFGLCHGSADALPVATIEMP